MGYAYNRIVLIGRLTRETETKFLTNGTQLTTFSMAVDRDYGDTTDFINCVTFGKTAEFAANYLQKGKLILVEGSLNIDRWEKDGEKKSAPKVNVRTIKFLEKKGAENVQQTGEEIEFFGSDVPETDEVPF